MYDGCYLLTDWDIFAAQSLCSVWCKTEQEQCSQTNKILTISLVLMCFNVANRTWICGGLLSNEENNESLVSKRIDELERVDRHPNSRRSTRIHI